MHMKRRSLVLFGTSVAAMASAQIPKMDDIIKIGETSLPIRIVAAFEDVKSMAETGRRFANLTGSMPASASPASVSSTSVAEAACSPKAWPCAAPT